MGGQGLFRTGLGLGPGSGHQLHGRSRGDSIILAGDFNEEIGENPYGITSLLIQFDLKLGLLYVALGFEHLRDEVNGHKW